MRLLHIILVMIGVLLVLGAIALAWQLHARSASPSITSGVKIPLVQTVPGVPPLPPLITDTVGQANGLVVAWTAHAGARLEPCGCVAGMSGGLARRATLLSRVPAEHCLVLEVGGWSGGSADYELVRATTYLRGLALTHLAALGLGGAELRLGRAPLGRLLHAADELGVPVASANLSGSDGGAIGHRLVRLTRLGRSLAITAVCPAGSGDGLIASDPAEAVAALLPSLDGASLVVLADLDEEGCSALARAVPGVALVVGGDVQQPSHEPRAVGAARVVYVANDGKTLGWWPWGAGSCAFELISDHIPDHPQVRQLIRDYQETIGTMDLTIDEHATEMTVLPQAQAHNAHYVGSQQCIGCHASAGKVHAHSAHALAFASLRSRSYQLDPDCLRCHVVGLSLPDGYRRKQPNQLLAEVGCESCHGRGSVHASEHATNHASSGSLEPVTPATCVRCHDPENSPTFDYASYWERIRHDAH